MMLPLNDPRFTIQVIPEFVNFGHINVPPVTQDVDLIMFLSDGQGIVTGSEILLTTNNADFILHPDHYNSPTNPTYNQIPPNYADLSALMVTTYEGWSHAWARVYRDAFPYGDDQTNTPSISTVTFTGQIPGQEVENSTDLFVYRFAGAPPF